MKTPNVINGGYDRVPSDPTKWDLIDLRTASAQQTKEAMGWMAATEKKIADRNKDKS